MAETIKQVLMRRDRMTDEAAEELIQAAREELYDRLAFGEDASELDSEICMEFFGLEPDYIMELL